MTNDITARVALTAPAELIAAFRGGVRVDVIVHAADGGVTQLADVTSVSLNGDDGVLAPAVDSAVPGSSETSASSSEQPGRIARRAVISLESTSSEAETLFRSAIASIDGIPGNQVEGISPLYNVTNYDGPDAMAAVIQITSRLGARHLIAALGTVEASLADQVDLDLVDMDGVTSDEPDCRVPWPSASHRAAVLAPWLDMDSDARLGKDPVSFLLAMAPDADRAGLLSANWILGGLEGNA
ncbi:2-amino-4-hydroxy-6-hydroxymethyldihydropteridine diphosphokinase [Bifidobacterium sp. UBA744]|uniref:2-amino-4-hydroxy-6- hydroxymethyldihydropteridine diphosphokinase n=1 Tax=Bifidobacterium sp. UBA744 TaxID=1946112 RepID=UPI0039C89086